MSYTDYLNLMKVNMIKVIDTQMRLPDASSYTWRTKLAATSVNDRSKHAINNTHDPRTVPTLTNKKAMSYEGTGFGGRVPDASTFTMGLSSASLGNDDFTGGRITLPCSNVRPSPSKLVGELTGNADRGNINRRDTNLQSCAPSRNTGTSMNWKSNTTSYIDTTYLNKTPGTGAATCHTNLRAPCRSQHVDTYPDIKTRKVTQLETTGSGTTFTQGAVKVENGDLFGREAIKQNIRIPQASVPFNSERARFVTAATGPQVGGTHRAPKVGGAAPLVRHSISHRGWGGYNFSKRNIGNTEPKAER